MNIATRGTLGSVKDVVARFAVVLTMLFTGVLLAGGWQALWRGHPPAMSPGEVKAALGQLPLSFIENKGQIDPRVAYYVQGSTMTIYFTSAGVTFSLGGKRPEGGAVPSPTSRRETVQEPPIPLERWTLKLDFINANPNVKPVARAPQETKISYFKGPGSSGRRGSRPTRASSTPTCGRGSIWSTTARPAV